MSHDKFIDIRFGVIAIALAIAMLSGIALYTAAPPWLVAGGLSGIAVIAFIMFCDIHMDDMIPFDDQPHIATDGLDECPGLEDRAHAARETT